MIRTKVSSLKMIDIDSINYIIAFRFNKET